MDDISLLRQEFFRNLGMAGLQKSRPCYRKLEGPIEQTLRKDPLRVHGPQAKPAKIRPRHKSAGLNPFKKLLRVKLWAQWEKILDKLGQFSLFPDFPLECL